MAVVLFNPLLVEDKEVYTFPKGISPKVNIIAQREFKLTQFEASVQHFGHYVIETPPLIYE